MRVIAQLADVSPVKPGVAAAFEARPVAALAAVAVVWLTERVDVAPSDEKQAMRLAELEGMSDDDAAPLLGADAPEGRGT